jgi:hypothetical protein
MEAGHGALGRRASADERAAAGPDLDGIERLHKDEMIGPYDAAVIDKQNAKPHVVKRMDRPHIRVIPEWFGGGTCRVEEVPPGPEPDDRRAR